VSTHVVEVTSIVDVRPHPNADRLELATVKDWQCVVGKDTFKPGDPCVYIPIDSVLPQPVMDVIFSGAKIKPSPRVKTIKLRGAISQGIAVRPSELGVDAPIGKDVAKTLGITKYEPPEPSFQGGTSTPKTGRSQTNPHFRKYTGIENAKNYRNVFEEGEHVIVTEKIHGTNFRAGYVPFHTDTVWKKVKKFFGMAPKFEFVYGSHNVQLQSKLLYTGFYDTNVYAEAVKKYRLQELLKPGEVVYGEVYGAGIQKGYTYGCAEGERKLALFDVMIDGKYLDPVAFEKFADARQLPRVPVLYRGPFDKDGVKALTVGDSVLVPTQKIREGVVCKPVVESATFIGRKVLKFISDAYLLGDQTDFH